jgi:very-short-patch-repair endonuclease
VTLGAEDPDGMLVIGRVDLVDVAAGIVIEAESWEFHGSKEAFARDLRRYTAMVRAGWRVLRFGWDEVMHEQETVRAVVADVLALTNGAAPARLVRRRAG